MLFSLSAGLLGETQLTRDLVFGRKRAQFVPGRVLDLDADLATFLLPQIFDLARIEHGVRAFGRRRRFEVTRELGDLRRAAAARRPCDNPWGLWCAAPPCR